MNEKNKKKYLSRKQDWKMKRIFFDWVWKRNYLNITKIEKERKEILKERLSSKLWIQERRKILFMEDGGEKKKTNKNNKK